VIILGVDPGLRKTGYGIIEKDGQTYRFVEAGVIRLDNIADTHDRLLMLHNEIERIILTFKPSCMSLEKVFLGKNVRSAFMIGEARAVCIIVAKRFDIPIYEYATRSVKQGLTGFGASGKESVKHMVKLLLGVKEDLKDDASDALALAIFHGNIEYTWRKQ